jgi:hypothetical protein
MGTEYWWNDTDWGKQSAALVERYWQGETEVLGEKLSQCHFFHHNTHMDLPEIEPGPERWQARTKNLIHGKNLHKTNIKPELYINIQSVPRSKHTPSLLYKPVS